MDVGSYITIFRNNTQVRQILITKALAGTSPTYSVPLTQGSVTISYGTCSECGSVTPQPEPEPQPATFVCPDYPGDLTLSLNNSVTIKGKSYSNPIDLYWVGGISQQTITADWNSANIGNATPNIIPSALSGYVNNSVSSNGINHKRMTILINNNQVNYGVVNILACYFEEEANL